MLSSGKHDNFRRATVEKSNGKTKLKNMFMQRLVPAQHDIIRMTGKVIVLVLFRIIFNL